VHDLDGLRRRQRIGGRNDVPERVGKAQTFPRNELARRSGAEAASPESILIATKQSKRWSRAL